MSAMLKLHLDLVALLDLVIRYVVAVLSSIILNLAISTSHIHGGKDFFSAWRNHSEYYTLIKYSASLLAVFAVYYVKKKGWPGMSFILAVSIILVGLNACDLLDALKMCFGGFSMEVLIRATGQEIRGPQHEGSDQIMPAIKPQKDIILRPPHQIPRGRNDAMVRVIRDLWALLIKWARGRRDEMPDKSPENSGRVQSAAASKLHGDVRSLREQLDDMRREHEDQMTELKLQMTELKLQMTELMEKPRIGHPKVVRFVKRKSHHLLEQEEVVVLTATTPTMTSSSS